MNAKEGVRKTFDKAVSRGIFYCPKCGAISEECKIKRLQELEVKKKNDDVYDKEVDYGEMDCCDYMWDDVEYFVELGCGCRLEPHASDYLVFRQGFVYLCKAEPNHKKVMKALHEYRYKRR